MPTTVTVKPSAICRVRAVPTASESESSTAIALNWADSCARRGVNLATSRWLVCLKVASSWCIPTYVCPNKKRQKMYDTAWRGVALHSHLRRGGGEHLPRGTFDVVSGRHQEGRCVRRSP